MNIKVVLFFVAAQPKVVLQSSVFKTSPDVAVINNQLNKSSAHTAQAHDEGTS